MLQAAVGGIHAQLMIQALNCSQQVLPDSRTALELSSSHGQVCFGRDPLMLKHIWPILHPLVTSKLDVCFTGLHLKNVQKRNGSYWAPGLRLHDFLSVHLYLLPNCFWAQFKVLVLTFKALNGLDSQYSKVSCHMDLPFAFVQQLRLSSIRGSAGTEEPFQLQLPLYELCAPRHPFDPLAFSFSMPG